MYCTDDVTLGQLTGFKCLNCYRRSILRASRENAQKLGGKQKGKRNATLQFRDQVLSHNPLRVLKHIL